MKHLIPSSLLLLAALSGCASIPSGNLRCASSAPSGKTAWFAGNWTTNYGPMHLDQTGANVEGTYTDNLASGAPGTISGTVSGPTLTFHWVEGKMQDDTTFTMCADAASFAGGYEKYPWSATLVPGSAPPQPKAQTAPRPENQPAETAPAEKTVEKPKPRTKAEQSALDSQL